RRGFIEAQADPDRDDQQDERQPERNSPAPALVERIVAKKVLADDDDDQREEEAERCGRLDPRRVRATPALRRMLGDVGRRAAVGSSPEKNWVAMMPASEPYR